MSGSKKEVLRKKEEGKMVKKLEKTNPPERVILKVIL